MKVFAYIFSAIIGFLLFAVCGWIVGALLPIFETNPVIASIFAIPLIIAAIILLCASLLLVQCIKSGKTTLEPDDFVITKVDICVILAIAAAALITGFVNYTDSFDVVNKIIVPALDYLGTRPVAYILAAVLFVPLLIRKWFDVPNNKTVNIIHILIVVIGIGATIPIYQAYQEPEKYKEERAYKECHMCGTKYYRDTDLGGNYTSIYNTNMCKKCYNSYKTVQDAYDHYKLNN